MLVATIRRFLREVATSLPELTTDELPVSPERFQVYGRAYSPPVTVAIGGNWRCIRGAIHTRY